jgi:hypothetical protein
MTRLLQVLKYEKSPDGEVQLLVLKGDNKTYSRSVRPVLVNLNYCPFCGTRIEADWVISIQERGRA